MSAAALYLHLRALGLELVPVQRPEHPDGCVIRLRGLHRLEPVEREHIRRLISANKAALVALLASGSPAALAVRKEGSGYGSNKRSRKAAA